MRIITAKNTNDVASKLFKLIKEPLENGKRVLWLISGGSSIPVACEASKLLTEVDCRKLYITLVDEKIIKDKNAPGNMQQLLDKGFIVGGANLIPILQGSMNLQESADKFEANLQDQISKADFSIGQFGLGEGYHTGGILANSPAITDESYVRYYHSEEAEHITVTTKVITLLDVAFINSMGVCKKPLVDHFLDSDESINNEPTQALKSAKLTILCTGI